MMLNLIERNKQFYLIDMSNKTTPNFYKESPRKIYNDASKFTKTIGKKFDDTPLPYAHSKQKYIKNLAEDRTDDVRYAIDDAKYQNELYRKLEAADHSKRVSIEKKIEEKEKHNEKNLEELKKKEDKEVERINKHLQEVYKKHVEIEKNAKHRKDDEALSLRKSLLEFYAKEKERKKEVDAKQISVGTCYQDAVNRLDRIHQKNQEYSLKSEREHMMRMVRNSGKEKNLLTRSCVKSAENKKKEEIYYQNCEILGEKEHRYIQTYAKDLDTSIKCFDHKGKEVNKEKERIHKFFKERVEKWKGLKHRVEEQKAVVPHRCQSIMQKTTKASFRQTVSSFKDSKANWKNIVMENKSAIYEKDEADKDKIMEAHLDLRLRNTNSFKVNEQIGSMRNKARKVTLEYL